MDILKNTLAANAQMLKGKVSKYAYYGLCIAVFAIIVATVAVSITSYGELTLHNLIRAQRENIAIWILDLTPFIFALWGQYVSQMIAYEASAMVADQTQELRIQASTLEEQAMHEMTHDSVTGLPNRALFLDRLSQILTLVRQDKSQLAVLLITFPQLKEINNTLGHYNGDRVLKQVGVRLEGLLQKPNSIAHTAEFQFGAIIANIKSQKDALSYVKKIQNAFKTSFALEELTLKVHPNIGLVLSPEHGADTETLMQRAAVAMEVALDGNADYILYSPKLDKNSQRHLILMNELHKAIENDELMLYYQPKVDLKGDGLAVEALLRWQHEQYGFMEPNDFIPLAERTGLTKVLSTWVINKALEQCAKWRDAGQTITISVNLSALDLMDVELSDKISGQLALYGVPHHCLVIEITESSIMKDQDRALRMLTRLADIGIQISIDDFGTGYSSLAYLSRLPATEIKIDMSFVANMIKSKDDYVIVRATIDLGHNLGLSVVAEGVEDEQIYKELKLLNCDIAQGYYISKPLSVEDFDAWLATSSWSETAKTKETTQRDQSKDQSQSASN